MKMILSGCLLLFSAILSVSSAQPVFIKDSLEAYIKKGMQDWDIPGLAIAIVKDGKPVMIKGYGVKSLETNEPVDTNTLFFIASNTKLFTGTALAQLENNGKLLLNDKITKYFPDFRLYDSFSTALVTIRDMLSHRIGTKTFQGDFTFWNSAYNRRGIIGKMRLLKPSGVFRQTYGYCNSCYLTAGEIIPKVSGKPWEVYVYDSIVAPLQMTHTQMLHSNAAAFNNIAVPYTTSFTGKLQKLPYDVLDNIAPAGSMVSCVSDMAHWLQMQLDTGRYSGRQVIPVRAIMRTRAINTITNSFKSPGYPGGITGYALGVEVEDYAGKQIYEHTGGADGFVTNTCFVPEEKLGITILTNNDSQDFFELLRYKILDTYLHVDYADRQVEPLQYYMQQKEKAQHFLDTLQQLKAKNAKPSLPIQLYTGIYTNELFGTITMTQLSANSLSVKFKDHNRTSATLTHLKNDEWELLFDPVYYGVFRTRFTIENNKVKSISIKVADFIEYDPYLFTKME